MKQVKEVKGVQNMGSISLSNTINKIDEQEAMSLTYASLKEAANRKEDSITTERLEKDNTILGTYKIISDPISGGMGSVWQVHHESWNMDLAMKRPRPKYFAEGGAERKKNFLRECENWIRLGLHPNIVSCYYVREISGVPSVFSEWMDGGSLKDRIQDRSLYCGTTSEVQERILDIAIQAARGLLYSHTNKLLHQDIKPGNLLLTREWDAKIADFGLASTQTLLGSGKGTGYTLEYCPREQASGEEPARWMDIYAWALTALEMYAGERLWEKGEEAAERCGQYFDRCRAEVPANMRDLIVSCLTDKPADFRRVLESLEQIYREVTGHKYPRNYPEKAASDTADSLNNRAMSYLDLGMPEEAQKLWEEALLHEPDHADTLFNRELYLMRTSRKTDSEAMLVLNSYETTKAIGAADMIAGECGGTYASDKSGSLSWTCPPGNVFEISKIEPDAVYALIIARDHPRTLTGLAVIPADGSREKEYLDPLDEIREKEYELYPWVTELEQYLRPKKDTRIDFMDVHSGKGWAAFMIFDTVCLYDLKTRKIIGELKTDNFYPKTAFRFNPEGTRLILYSDWGKGQNETLLLEVPSMRVVLAARSSFVGFGGGERTLLRGLVEDGEGSASGGEREGSAAGRAYEALVQVDADGSERILCRFEKEPEECHEFVGAKEPFLCYRYKETGETFRLDSEYHKVSISENLFKAAANTCFYDPDQQLLYCGEHEIEVWDAEKGSFLFTSWEGFSDYRWDERRQAFLSYRNEYLGAFADEKSWMWTPLPRRKDKIQPAQWRISHILTSQKRVSEDERIKALMEEFDRATDDDTARAIEIYREARGIEGFAFTEEAEEMTEWLDEYAERTGILEARPLGLIKEIPPTTEIVYQLSSCSRGRKAFFASNGGYRVVLLDEDGELERVIKLPKCAAAARGSRIYVFTEPMQWAVYDLWGNLLKQPKSGWPPRWQRDRADVIHYSYCDMDSAGKRTLFTVYDEKDKEVGGTFLLEMDSGEILRLSDRGEYGRFLKDDTVVLATEEGVSRFDPESGRLIGKAAEAPGEYVFSLFTSQERDRFFIRKGDGVLIYDMDCTLLGKCDVRGDSLHCLPGGRFLKVRGKIWNALENKIEVVIHTPDESSDYAYRCVTISPDGREAYAEKRKLDDSVEVTRFRLEYDYSPREDEEIPEEGPKEEAVPQKAEDSKKAEVPKKEEPRRKGFFGFLFGRKKEEPPVSPPSVSPTPVAPPVSPSFEGAYAEENRQLQESRQRHASDDKRLEKFLQNPLQYPPVREYREADKRRPAGSRPRTDFSGSFVRYEDLDDKVRLMVKVMVNDIQCTEYPEISETLSWISRELGENGRFLVRRSGVIPQIAILVEADTEELCSKYMNRYLDALWEAGYMEK